MKNFFVIFFIFLMALVLPGQTIYAAAVFAPNNIDCVLQGGDFKNGRCLAAEISGLRSGPYFSWYQEVPFSVSSFADVAQEYDETEKIWEVFDR